MDVNYASPVMVNGFSCMNCAEVALAKKDINPAHPNWTPGETKATAQSSALNTPSVLLSGALSGALAGGASIGSAWNAAPGAGGSALNLVV